MKTRLLVVALFLLFVSCVSQGRYDKSSDGLSKENRSSIYDSCFEVLVEKPLKDTLTYEKPLPWDEIPYNIRTDKYFSIGTAFAVSETELLSAFHVFNLTRDSLVFTRFFIRDRNGKVNEVDRVTSMDSHRDFIKFTVKNRKFSSWLNLNREYRLNETVYSVGNAYGEGIVIRKGDLIGKMPEPEAGRFSLLKSSSDVNSGNSGGPLLNEKGQVVGIVVSRKGQYQLLAACGRSDGRPR